MKIIHAFIKQRPMLGFYALAFALSWGGFLLAVALGPGGFAATPEQLQIVILYAVPELFLGPCILLTGLLDRQVSALSARGSRGGGWMRASTRGGDVAAVDWMRRTR